MTNSAKEASIDDLSADLDQVLGADPSIPGGTDLEEDPIEDEGLTDEEDFDEEAEIDDTLVAEGDLDDEDGTDPEEDPDDDDETDDPEDEEFDDEEEVEEDPDFEIEDEGESLELSDDLLDAVVVDPKRGDAVSLRELFDQRFTRDDYRENATRWRSEIEASIREEYQPVQALADERQQLEREFVNLPVEYTLAAANQAAKLGIAPPVWPQMIEAARKQLIEQGLYNPEAAQARAQGAFADHERKTQEEANQRERAQAWMESENVYFEEQIGVRFNELPEKERKVIQAAFSAAEGSPRLADLYRDYFGDRQPSSSQSQPAEKQVKGGTNGKKAPRASTSNRKLLNTLTNKNRKRSDSRGRSGGQSQRKGKRKQPSVDKLSSDIDAALGL